MILDYVSSVLELDILLAMRASEGVVEADHLARQLRFDPAACGAALEKLAAAGLVARDGAAYAYRPSAADLAPAVDALADCYARRRVSVIRFIYQRPTGVSAFADAFKFRKDG